MSLIAITSAGDAPGATTTAVAMALTWPGQVLLAECAPAGGKIVRGYFRCHTPADGGLWDLALAAVQGQEAAHAALWEQVVPLDRQRQRLLLPGLTDPFLSTEISAATWETLAASFADLPLPVLADTGPIGPEQPFAMLRAAELIIMVMRPTLGQVAAARPRLVRLRQTLGPDVPVGLCLIGERPYTSRDIRGQLGDFALTFVIPPDVKAAAVISDGEGSDWTRRKFGLSDLMRAARAAAHATTKFLATRQELLDGQGSSPVRQRRA